MKDLSHLNVGDFVAVLRERYGDIRVPQYHLLKITRKTKSSFFCVHPKYEKSETQIHQNTGRVKGTYNYAVEATSEIAEENVKQTEEFERYQKAYNKYSEMLFQNWHHLSIEQLEILGEAWDRCKLLEKRSA